MTLLRWFRDLLARWLGSTPLRVLRRGRLTIHHAPQSAAGARSPHPQRIAEIADASIAGAVHALERLDARLPAGVSAAGILMGDRMLTLKLTRAVLRGPENTATGTLPLAWLRRGAMDSQEDGE